MFRFSRWFMKKEELSNWERWFNAKNIKTEIRRENGHYALYREGIEAKEEESGDYGR